MVTRLLKKWLIPAHWDMMTYHSTLSIFPRNSFAIIEIDNPCLASRASHGVLMSISTVVISNLTHVWYPYLLSHLQCIITFNRVTSRVGKKVLDVWPRASYSISCIARCRWIIIYFILLYRISNDLNYIILSVVERLPQKQLISVSVQIWNGIVLSFLSLVLLSYLHWKLSVLFFQRCYYHQCQYYFSIMNIIIIIKNDIIDYYYYYYHY